MMRCLLIALIVGLCLFNLPTEAQGQFFDPTPDTVLTAAWNPQGTLIATGHTDGTIRIWGQDGELVQTLSQHTDMINSLAWNSDGSLLASSSRDLTVKIWNATNWDSSEASIDTLDDQISLAWSENNLYGGTAPFNNTPPISFWIWDAEGNILTIESGTIVSSIDFRPDGKKIALGDFGRIDILDSNSLISEEIILSPIQNNLEIASAVLWKPDGTELIAGYRNGKIRVWNTNTTETQTIPLLELQGNDGDGSQIAYGNADGVIQLMDAP